MGPVIDWDLWATILSMLPLPLERIVSYSKSDNKIFIASDTGDRYLLKLVELGPVAECVNTGEHQTLFYIDPVTKTPVFRDKIAYDTEKEAIHAAMVVNVQDKTIHKRQAYKCSVCHKYHIGRGQTVLTDEDKRKLRIKHNIK